MAADIGHGTTIAFGTTSAQTGVTFLSFSGEISRAAINTSHMGISTFGAMTFIPDDIHDPGTIEVECHWDAGEFKTTTALWATAAETITITFPDSDTISFSGFVTNVRWNAPRGDVMTATITIKCAGALT